jgi:hypothetical protein
MYQNPMIDLFARSNWWYPKEIKPEFLCWENLKEVQKDAEQLQTYFNLSSLEFSALFGHFLSIYLCNHLEEINKIYETDFINKINNNPDIENFAFDICLGSDLHYKFIKPVPEEKRTAIFDKIIISNAEKIFEQCTNLNMQATAKSVLDVFCREDEDFYYENNIKDLKTLIAGNELIWQFEFIKKSSEKTMNDRDYNLKFLCFENIDEAFEGIYHHKIMENDDPCDVFMNLSQRNSNEIGYLFDLEMIEKTVEIYSGNKKKIEEMIAALHFTFPYIKNIKFKIRNDLKKANIIEKYLNFGGNIEMAESLNDSLYFED